MTWSAPGRLARAGGNVVVAGTAADPMTMQQREYDETSKALLDSARHLLVTEGAAALTVRRIASDVGLSTMNVYSRFGGKDGIVDVLYRESFMHLFEMLGSVPRTSDVRTNVRAFTSAYRAFALEHRHEYDLIFRSAAPEFTPSSESSEVASALLSGIIERVELAQSEGLVTSEIPARQVAVWIWATCHGMLSLEFDRVGSELLDWQQSWDAAIDTMAAILAGDSAQLPNLAG